MEQQELLEAEPVEVMEARRAQRRATRKAAAAQRPARVRTVQRQQVEWRATALEDLLPAEHRARAVWAFVERFDLSAFYERIGARHGHEGRTATDPKVLLALWLYAVSQGVGSARTLAELCQRHDAYRWLAGGVGMNHHTLSDFYSGYGAAVEGLLKQVLAVLMHQGVLSLQRVAQDGTRIRAAASRTRARRRGSLEQCLEAARAQVEAVRVAASAAEAAQGSRRRRAAQERAARERVTRVEAALAELATLEAERAAYKPGAKEPVAPPRASTTDPAARKMRMGDGGFRLGYNVQLATATEAQVVVGVAVTQARTDFAEAAPMLDAIAAGTGVRPQELLVDGGYTSRDTVDAVAARAVTLYGPLGVRKGKPDPYAPQAHDSEAMRGLKARMQTAEGREIYKERARSAELVNADLKRWRTLERMTVRGVAKVQAVVLLNVLTYDMLRCFALLPGF